ncbi:MAG TPA: hypothetical protein VHY35_19700 [Stellaceae bacterium]|jgi:hypothetical protein|nr:hypothetical protein [Stellaceae bacterium]
MKYVLGALTAITLLAGVAAAQPAEARCYNNGYGWHCWHHSHHWHHRHYWHRGW